MKYRALNILMLLTLAFGIVVVVSSFPPAMAASVTQKETVSQEFLSQAAQIKLLIGAIGLLFVGHTWWLRRYINANDDKHIMHFTSDRELREKISTTDTNLREMITEHRVTTELSGCNSDANAIRKVLEEALAPMNLYLHQRRDDPKEQFTATKRKEVG